MVDLLGGRQPSWLVVRSRPWSWALRWVGFAVACVVASFVGSSRRAQYWGRADEAWRDTRPLTRAIVAAARVTPGMSVADIGAGGGYFTFRMARVVGPRGRVVATDADWHMVGQLYLERSRRAATNVFPRLVGRNEVGLEAGGFDVVMIVNTYQFTDCDEARNRRYLRDLARALRPGGRVIVAEGFIHASGWRAPDGRATRCGNLPPAELARQAAPELSLAAVVPIEHRRHPYHPHEGPGFVLSLVRRGATAAR